MTGLAEPSWPIGKKPSWLPEDFSWTVGCSYRGLPGDGTPIRNLTSASIAFDEENNLRTFRGEWRALRTISSQRLSQTS